jgi:pimeloyl-ACP methyl ester carboxylesterase
MPIPHESTVPEAQRFLDAERRALEAAAVSASARSVDSPTIGGRARVLVAGDGPPVVMLGGIGTPAAMWAPLLTHLTRCRVHAVDLPGFGLTDTAPHLASNLRAAAVGFVDDVLDGLGLQRPAVIGSSLGSLWSMWHGVDRPGRVRAHVHIGCPALALDTSAPVPMRLLGVRGLGRALAAIRRPSPAQVRSLSRMVHEHPLPPTIAELLVATERLPGCDATMRSLLHHLLRIRGARPGRSLTPDELGTLDRPTLLVIGRDDPMGGADVGRRLVAALPDAELLVAEGGHAPWLRHADSVGPAVASFLDRRVPPRPLSRTTAAR